MSDSPGIDKRQVRLAFGRAAERYDDIAVLQREIGLRMRERLDYIKIQPQRILDVGAGTGLDAEALGLRYHKARVIALDFALPMLQKARRRGSWLRRPSCLCADLEHLPVADQCIDLVYSNVALQWSTDLAHTFSEFLRVLRPGGLLMFTTFGTDTLKELRAAWANVDGNSHVSPFYDLHDIGDMLLRTPFNDPVVDVENLKVTYQSVDGLMADLKGLGAHNATTERSRTLTGKGRLQKLCDAYEEFRTGGRLPASYEVVYGHAWAPVQRQVDGVTLIPVDSLRPKRP